MRILPIIALVFTAYSLSASAAGADDKTECEKVKAEIRKIQAKMRSGYRAAQGIKLDARLLELRERRRKVCR